jgi:hypothetical protein
MNPDFNQDPLFHPKHPFIYINTLKAIALDSQNIFLYTLTSIFLSAHKEVSACKKELDKENTEEFLLRIVFLPFSSAFYSLSFYL